MKTCLITTLLFICSFILTHAQESKKNKVFNATEFGIYFGSRDELVKEDFYEVVRATHTAYIIGLRNVRGWELSEKFALGLGIGYEGIIVKGAKNPDQIIRENGNRDFTYKYTPGTYYHTIPLYGQARYYFRKKPESAFIYSDLGSFFNLNSSIKKSLLMWGLGIAQRYKLKSGTLISVGLDFQERYLLTQQNEKQRVSNIGLKIGLLVH